MITIKDYNKDILDKYQDLNNNDVTVKITSEDNYNSLESFLSEYSNIEVYKEPFEYFTTELVDVYENNEPVLDVEGNNVKQEIKELIKENRYYIVLNELIDWIHNDNFSELFLSYLKR